MRKNAASAKSQLDWSFAYKAKAGILQKEIDASFAPIMQLCCHCLRLTWAGQVGPGGGLVGPGAAGGRLGLLAGLGRVAGWPGGGWPGGPGGGGVAGRVGRGGSGWGRVGGGVAGRVGWLAGWAGMGRLQ